MSFRVRATRPVTLAAIVGLAASLLPAPTVAAPPGAGTTPGRHAGDAIPGRVIVRFKAGATEAQRGAARSAVDAAGPGASHRLAAVPGLEMLATRLPADVAVSRLMAKAGVDYAEPDRYVAADAAPNDPLYSEQWALENAGDHDIDAEAAWAVTTGSSDVVVAVIDSGVDLDHPDLAANLWHNTADVAANGIDDDDNGFVDDRAGWDFWDDDANPADLNGHGTFVAGIIAARAGNSQGVSGVAPDSRVMPLRVLGSDGIGSISDGAAAIEYAWRNGARIANLSWGYSGWVSRTLSDAIDVAGAHGMLVVAAAGNDGTDIDATPFYPAGLPSTNLVSVAATDATDALWPGSNRGRVGVDLAAPGADVTSTWLGSSPGGDYTTGTGTSFASPHVAGVAALLLAANPTWSVTLLRVRLFQSARPLASLTGRMATGAMLNAGAALLGVVDKPPNVTITAPASGSSALPGTAVTLSASATDAEDGSVAASLAWRSSLQGALGQGPSITVTNLVAGVHVITAMAQDSAGHRPIRAIQLTVGPTVNRIVGSPDNDRPTIAVTPGGTPIVGWMRHGVGAYVASPGPGTSWPAVLVSSSADDRAIDLTIAPDGTPTMAIERFWSSLTTYGDAGVILATRSGSTWSTERLTDSCTDGQEGCGYDTRPSVVVTADGRPHVAVVRSLSNVGDGNVSPAVIHAWRTATGAAATEMIHTGTAPSLASIAVAPDGSLHAVWMETAGPSAGVWYATRATGHWVASRIPTSTGAAWPHIAISSTGVVRVIALTAAGVAMTTRTASSWSQWTPIVAGSFGELDVAQTPAGAIDLVLTRTSDTGTATGIVFATNAAGSWASTVVVGTQANQPAIAVDMAGHAHLAFRMGGAVRYATNSSGAWAVRSVVATATDDVLGYAVDGRGVAQAAISRFGPGQGLYLGQRTGAAWSMNRVTTAIPDGGAGFATSSIGEAHIAYATYFDPSGRPLADRSVLYTTNAAGPWTTTRLGTNAGGGASPALALDAGNKVHVAFVGDLAGKRGLIYATNRTGAWVAVMARVGVLMDPAIAIDGAGKVRIAVREQTGGGLGSRILAVSNATGSWLTTAISSGGIDFDPSIAIDPQGETSIAYWRSGEGLRLTEQRGSSWVTRLLDVGTAPYGASITIDANGQRHILFADGSLDYSVCSLGPTCPLSPGLLEAEAGDTGSFSVRHVTFNGSDVPGVLARGRDGSLGGVFVRAGVGVYEVILDRPFTRTTTTIDDLSPASLAKGQPTILEGRLHAGATNLASRTLVFKIDGVEVGRAVAGPDGIASVPWTAAIAAGAHTLTIGFAGGGAYLAARVGPRQLTVRP